MNKHTFYLDLKECESRFNYRKQDLYHLILKLCRNKPFTNGVRRHQRHPALLPQHAFCRRTLVIRQNNRLTDAQLNRLQTDLSDFLVPEGHIIQCGALPEEKNETGLLELPRPLIDFNRRDLGSLRLLNDAINT
jgi:hypothetical protein